MTRTRHYTRAQRDTARYTHAERSARALLFELSSDALIRCAVLALETVNGLASAERDALRNTESAEYSAYALDYTRALTL